MYLLVNFLQLLYLYSDVNLENEFAIPESRMREITMQDDSRNLDRLDNFMDMGGGFGEGDGDFELSSLEVLRDAIGPEDSILHESRDRPELDVSKAKSLKNDSLDQLSVEKAPNCVRESFGMGFGEMDGGFGPEHGELTSLEDLGMGLPSIDETGGLPLGSPQHDQTEDMETNQLPSDNNIIPKKRDAGSVMSDFTLASLDVSTVTFKKPHPPGEEGTPVVKKRKSTIANVSTADVEVKLSTNEIRNWFENQSDIEVDIISAPANKIALLPRLTSEQKPFEIPTSNGADEGLSRLVLLNCTVAEKVGSDDEDPNQSTVEDVLRGVGSMDEHISMADMDPINLEPIVHDQDTTNESHLLDAEDKHHTRESTAGFGEVGHDTYDQITGDPLQGIDMPTLEEEESLMNGDEDLGPKEDERPDEYERRKWNKKTQQVLNQVSKAFGKKASSVPFSKVLDSSSRKQAATNFFSLLLLTTRGSLKLQQDEPYGDLLITKGPAYQACIS